MKLAAVLTGTLLGLTALPCSSSMMNNSSNCFELFAFPEKLDSGGDLVISWKNYLPNPLDYLTISCGPTNGSDDYIDMIQVDPSTSSVRFEDLHMLRCDYTVIYYHSNGTKTKILGEISVPMSESINSPQHGHLALNEHADEMVLMFNSASNRTGEVRYGLNSHLQNIRQGTWTTYNASDMCHQPATIVAQKWFRHPGYMHKVILDSLEPSSIYFYQYGNDIDGWSSIYSFTSRPASNTTSPVKFIAYGDMGVGNAPAAWSTSTRVFEEVVNGYDSFLLHFGDISYARGIGLQWDKFFHLIQPYATRIPYMVSIGNHEYDYLGGGVHDPSHPSLPNGFHPSWGNYGVDSLGECGVPMVHRFTGPLNGNGLFWYSFDYSYLHVIQISSEHDYLPGSSQYQWLERDLKSIDRVHQPWIILTAHRMMYTTQVDEEADYLVSVHFRAAIEPLLRRFRVNLVLVGHQHSYERSCPVYDGDCLDQGTVHIVAGSAGAELEQSGFSPNLGNWSVAHVNAWGYLRLDATKESLHVAFVRNDNGNVYDQTTLLPWT